MDGGTTLGDCIFIQKTVGRMRKHLPLINIFISVTKVTQFSGYFPLDKALSGPRLVISYLILF